MRVPTRLDEASMRGNDAKRANRWELDGQTDRVNAGVIVTRDTNHASDQTTEPVSDMVTTRQSAHDVWDGELTVPVRDCASSKSSARRKPGRV